MLAGRPGAQSAGAGPGARASDPLGAPDGGRPRPGAFLDMKIHLEKNLEEERQLLLQQQKICRNRARKYFMESNRRRKAFEEKRKQQEEREYQMRERILQQRKQKFEEVTEKFQRAHIPLSQRRRAVFHNPVPPLEEALKQIQESNLKSEVNVPLSHKPATSWRSIPACPAISNPDPYLPGQLSASQAPLLYHHPQILPSYPAVSPTPQTCVLPSVPSTLAKTFSPAPLLSYPIRYPPHPTTPVTSSVSSSFPSLPASVPSGPPVLQPPPSQSSPLIPDPDSQNRLFHRTLRPKHLLMPQHSTPAALKPALIRRSLPAPLFVSPSPLGSLPVPKPSRLSSHSTQPAPPRSCITPWPECSARFDASHSVQKPVPHTTAVSHQPQAAVDHLPVLIPSHPPPCHSPSSTLPSSPSASTSSSPLVVVSSSSSILSSPSPSSSTSPPLPAPSVPLLPSPLPPSPSPCLPPTYLAFPSPVSPASSSFMISSSFPPMLHSISISSSPSPFIPIHPFNPPHWGKKVEKRREESGVEKKGIEKKKLRDDNFKEL